MNVDFLDAHHRHWDDAEMLFKQSRWANADHLYGVSAECGLKQLMIAFGMGVDAAGSPLNKEDKVHAQTAWLRYETYRSGHGAAAYVLPQITPFDDWAVSQRYAHRSNFDSAHVQAHRQGAEAVKHLITQATQNGLLQ